MADLTEQQLMMQDPEVLGLQRQRQLANLLTGQAFNAPQGQMISGHYVKPSGLQQALPMINAAIGGLTNANLDTKQTELAAALRGRNAAEIQEYARLQQTDPAKAIQYGLNSQNPTLKSIVAEDLKTQKYGEGEIGQRRNIATGQLETIGQGGAKYRAPITVDTGTSIELRDPNDPTKVLQRIPKSQMPTAGQVLETENGPMLVNTRTGQAQPIMAGGQAVAGGKPLTESQAKATAFQSQMIGAENNIKQLEAKGFNPASLQSQAALKVAGSPLNIAASPETQQYKQAQEQWAEAYLRFKTGAAATEGEVQRNIKTFFPQFGDKPAQIAQKADARRQAEQDIGFAAGMGAGRGAKPINLQPNSPQAPKKVVNFNDLP